MSTWPNTLLTLRDTIGIWTSTLDSVAPRASGEAAREIEALGYSSLWVPEAWGREAFTNAGLLLASTSSLVVGTGIASIWGRDAVATSNAAKTLSAAYHERFVLGLGVSHRPLVERLRGHEYRAPVASTRDYLANMDAAPMHAAEGETRVARVLAALGPAMLELAAVADGALTYLVTAEHTARARAILGDSFLGVEQAVVLGESREEFLRRAHDHLEFYTGLDNYRNSWRRLGFEDADFVRGGSTRLCDALVVHGDDDTVMSAVSQHRDAGADHVCLQVLGRERDVMPRDEWRQLGPTIANKKSARPRATHTK